MAVLITVHRLYSRFDTAGQQEPASQPAKQQPGSQAVQPARAFIVLLQDRSPGARRVRTHARGCGAAANVRGLVNLRTAVLSQ